MATACAGSEDGLEILLSKATNVLNETEDWEAIVGFCDRINKDPEGPQTALKLLVHKIQSPQEKESLLALVTLEACVKNCGRRFQQEVGKFRFLNEIIKLISPKFMGNQTAAKVKKKCIELLYNWSEVLEYEPKIKEAYQMLRRQGIIKYDPEILDRSLEPEPPLPPPPPRNSIFDNEEKSKLLSRLLRSKNPDDLMKANRLIKNMVKQDEERNEKVSQRIQQLDVVYNNVKLLNDMLSNYQPDSETESEKEIVKELYDNLDKQRPKLFRLASDADESDDSGISEILKANDEVIKVMARYEDIVNKAEDSSLLVDATMEFAASDRQMPSGRSDSVGGSARLSADLLSGSEPPSYSSCLLDDQLQKLGLDGGVGGPVTNGLDQLSSTQSRSDDLGDLLSGGEPAVTMSSANSLDFHLAAAGATPSFNQPVASRPPGVSPFVPQPMAGLPGGPVMRPPFQPSLQGPFQPSIPAVQARFQPPAPPPSQMPLMPATGTLQPLAPSTTAFQPSFTPLQPAPPTSQPVQDLGKMSQVVWNEAGSDEAVAKPTLTPSALRSLDALGQSVLQESLSTVTTTTEWSVRQPPGAQAAKIPMNQMTKMSESPGAPGMSKVDVEVAPLTDISVTLETIQPGSLSPLVAYDKNGLKIVFHFGKDRPRPDVQVVAISIMSTNTTSVKGFTFQAAVPKVMRVKLQPASATDLPAYNPILPPAAITQVMLIGHRPQDKVCLKFKITYSLSDVMSTDVGDVTFSCTPSDNN